MPSPDMQESGLAYTALILRRLLKFSETSPLSNPPSIEITMALLDGRLIPANIKPMSDDETQLLKLDFMNRLNDLPKDIDKKSMRWFEKHILGHYTDDIIASKALRTSTDKQLKNTDKIRASVFEGFCQLMLEHIQNSDVQKKIKLCLFLNKHRQGEDIQQEMISAFTEDLNYKIFQIKQKIWQHIKYQPNQLESIFQAIQEFDTDIKEHEFFEQVADTALLKNEAIAGMLREIKEQCPKKDKVFLATISRYIMAEESERKILRAFNFVFESVQSKDIYELLSVFKGLVDGALHLDNQHHMNAFQRFKQLRSHVFDDWEPYIQQVGSNLFNALLINIYHEHMYGLLRHHSIKTDENLKLWLYDWTSQELEHPTLEGFNKFIKKNHPEFLLDRTQYWLYLHADHLLDMILSETNDDLNQLSERIEQGDGRLLFDYPQCHEHQDITCINDFLSAPLVLKTFQEKFQAFDISKGLDSQDEFSSTFMRYFFEPLMLCPRWNQYLNQDLNVDETKRLLLKRQIASAMVYKIQSQWWQAENPEHYKNKMVCLTTWIHAYPEERITEAQNVQTSKFIDNQLQLFREKLLANGKNSSSTQSSNAPLTLEEEFNKCLRTIRASTVFKASPNGGEILYAKIKIFLNQIHKEDDIKESLFIKVRTVVLADRRLSVEPEDLPKFTLKNPKESVRFFKGKTQKSEQDQKELYRTLSQHELQKSPTTRKKLSPSSRRKAATLERTNPDTITKDNHFNGI